MLLSRLDAAVQLLAVANRGLETGGGSRLIGLLGWREGVSSRERQQTAADRAASLDRLERDARQSPHHCHSSTVNLGIGPIAVIRERAIRPSTPPRRATVSGTVFVNAAMVSSIWTSAASAPSTVSRSITGSPECCWRDWESVVNAAEKLAVYTVW
jgi:hypothetical protein